MNGKKTLLTGFIFLLACASIVMTGMTSCAKNDNSSDTQGSMTAEESKMEQQAIEKMKGKLMKDRWFEVNITGDWNMDLHIIRMLSAVWHGMGDVGEILDTASRIRSTSELSWYREWRKTADRVAAIGEAALARGHRISAGQAFMRATNYYRAAEFYLHANPNDPRILETYRLMISCFKKGLEFLDMPATEVRIPYEGTTLRGYLWLSPKAGPSGKAPILVVQQGYDGALEETKYIAEEAIKRGYHCLMFEGPGQGMSIREQNLTFRYDWEKVMTPVIDWVEQLPQADRNNIIVMGISFGGYCVTRAAAFEHRPRIYIANPPYTNLYSVVDEVLDEKYINLFNEDPDEFDRMIVGISKLGVAVRWFIYDGIWKFGAKSPSDFLNKLKQCDTTGILGKITSTFVVMDGVDEIVGKGQMKKVYDSLTCPKYYMLFDAESTASLHCQNGDLSVGTQRMFDWLDEQLGR